MASFFFSPWHEDKRARMFPSEMTFARLVLFPWTVTVDRGSRTVDGLQNSWRDNEDPGSMRRLI